MTDIATPLRRRPAARRKSARVMDPMQALMALALSMLLAACGPGTGGTGTGPDSSASTAPGGSLVPAGDLLGAWRGGEVLAAFEPLRIQVRQGCRVLHFEGAWATDPVRGLAVALRPDGASAGALAGDTLTLQVTPVDANRIRISVRDSAGADVIGPLEAQRAGASAALSEPGC